MQQRLINCDFLNVGGFVDLSNKAKLVYFCFLINADDMGFVGNGTTIVNNLQNCETNFENVLFAYSYYDALKELCDKGLLYEFVDNHNNKTYLMRHWFFHNNYKKFLRTNYIGFLSRVELVNNEYVYKETIIKKDKLKQIKTNQIKINNLNDNSSLNSSNNDDTNWEKDWETTLKDLDNLGKEKNEKS